MFNFGQPLWLLALLLIPLFFFLKGRQGKPASVKFSSLKLLRKGPRPVKAASGLPILLFLVIPWALVVIALARPRLTETEENVQSNGVDIMLAIDVSGSMRAMDFFIEGQRDTRLEAVKTVVAGFIEEREFDRIGIVAFAEAPFLVSPLTLQHDWLKTNFARLEVGLISPGGTAVGDALGTSVNRLRELEAQSKVVILLSDGENNRGLISPSSAAEAAAAHGVKVYTIAAGSQDVVPFPRVDRNGRIFRDRNGRPIPGGRSNIPVDESTLKAIAETTGGRFYRATDTEGLERIYEEIDELEKTEVTVNSVSTHNELFAWPLWSALGLLCFGELLRNTRMRRIP
ncbi:MAG: VWA domain-containing protein [Opitutales bacterium]|nr:VWA domain-containing protein [Opitutales bacterium]NRA26398.1 VWA domain-containing protein [Opitutales bacterium]